MDVNGVIGDFRRHLWHFRAGGLPQLRESIVRKNMEANRGMPNPSTAVRLNPFGKKTQNLPGSWPLPDAEASSIRTTLNVGVILDGFSELAYRYEWNQLLLSPDKWRQQLNESTLDFLFVESAWHGNNDEWQYQLTGSKAPSASLTQLVAHCRDNGIPTVFWNKEDPAHFEDFIDTAALFDWVYTTDANVIPDYERRLGHQQVGLLPFAAQQTIHNPVRPPKYTEQKLRGAAFGGTYFRHKYPERREQMDYLLGGTLRAVQKSRSELDIYSRFQDVHDNYRFPSEYQKLVRGELTYPQMLTAYRSYKMFLNANSVVGSPTMCARRIFEITACGTPVLSSPSSAIEQYFPSGTVFVAGTEQEAYDSARALLSSPELRDRAMKLGQRRIWKEHTYTKRVTRVLDDLGLAESACRQPSISAMVSTNRPHQLPHVLGILQEQEDVELETLVLCHGFQLTTKQKREYAAQYGEVTWLEADSDVPLGQAYNLLAGVAGGQVVAKIDDDDYYSSNYLFDQLSAMDYAGADIVGKGAHYLYLTDMDATVLRFPEAEHKYRDFVSGPTIVTKRDLVLENPFPATFRGEDTGFLRGARDAGAVTYSADRFGFIQVRKGSGQHTWDISDTDILATSRLLAYGLAQDHVIF